MKSGSFANVSSCFLQHLAPARFEHRRLVRHVSSGGDVRKVERRAADALRRDRLRGLDHPPALLTSAGAVRED